MMMTNSTALTALQELYFEYGDTVVWNRQMKLLALNPILYLRDYRHLPEDIFQWKDDGQLHPAVSSKQLYRMKLCNGQEQETAPGHLCVGIGKYQTVADGMLYLCAVLHSPGGAVLSYAFGVFCSPELVRKALEIFFVLYEPAAVREPGAPLTSLLTSQNPIYRTSHYREIVSAFPIEPRMTQKGSRGQAAEVSTFFSQLMRRKGSIEFQSLQDGIDWITVYILKHNLQKQIGNV